MSSTNVNSSKNETLAFVVCGADKELKIEGKGVHDFKGPFSEKEITVYADTAKTAKLERRTIPMSCEAKINEMKAHKAGKKAAKHEVNHDNR